MLEQEIYSHPLPFRFENGGEIRGMQLKFYRSPRPYTRGEKVVWLCHALTGNADPEDWWPQMVGKGCPVDPERDYVVCVSMLCSAYGLCGPASIDPDSGKPYFFDFPKTTIRDMAAANDLVRTYLGIEKIDLLIGPSIGGFVAYEWLVQQPDVFVAADLVATAVRVPPYLTAFNESQRMALKLDPSFLAAESLQGGAEGLKCARAQALISYRSPKGYNLTQSEADQDAMFADRAASYQRYQGEKIVRRDFDAYNYWYLSYALDSMNIGRGRGGVEAALGRIQAKCRIVSITSDHLFPPELGREAAMYIPGAEHMEIESAFGHDGFLIEHDCLIQALGLN